MAVSEAKYELWKNKLLDLGKRNRLINYKDTKSSTLRFKEPQCKELYDYFVIDENPLVFPLPIEEELRENLFGEGEPVGIEYEGEIEEDTFFKTDKTGRDRQKVLRNLRNKAKTAIEEQGINMLYLSFGFLKYYEAEYSNAALFAPLVLVPVSLTIESITSPFVLQLHEDEITVNPTLAYKLDTEYGISLPEFDPEGDLESFFVKVERIVRPQKWSVERSTCLSMLSFLKINMYEDMKKHHDKIMSNPITRALCGDSSSLKKASDGLKTYDFDKNDKPKDVFQVVDADSSQQEAILYAKKGISYVLQGPPGTGKSQTITNIIAECLADGKKVLFVSEKMAALDVVYRRLQAAGLSDFCLVLHSSKAKKREVLDQLDQVLSLARKKASVTEDALRKLTNLEMDRQKLNEYVEQLHTKVPPLNRTIYEVYGAIANLRDCPDYSFDFPKVSRVTQDDFEEYLYLLDRYRNVVGSMTGDIRNNPWRGSVVESLSNELRQDINANAAKLSELVGRSLPVVKDSISELGLSINKDLESINNTVSLLSAVEGAKTVPAKWVLEQISGRISGEIYVSPGRHAKIKQLIEDYARTKEALSSGLFFQVATEADVSSLEKAEKEAEAIEFFINSDPMLKSWKTSNLNEIDAMLDEAERVSSDVHEYISEISEDYEKEIFSVDYRGIRNRVRTEYMNFWKVFKSSYKEDRQTVTACRRSIGKLISFDELCKVVDKLYALGELRGWFQENGEVFRTKFGSGGLDENTDYAAMKETLKAFTIILDLQKTLNELKEMLRVEKEKEDDLSSLFGSYYKGIDTDWSAIEKAYAWASVFKSSCFLYRPDTGFVQRVCTDPSFWDVCLAKRDELKEIYGSISDLARWFSSLFLTKNYDRCSLEELDRQITELDDNVLMLEEWIDYRTIVDQCSKTPLKSYMQTLSESDIDSDEIIPIFKKRFYNLWLDAILKDYPAVQKFRRKAQDSLVEEFKVLDRTQFDIAKARIRGRLINALPSMDHFTSGLDEISILKRELNKQRRIMPIRKLFAMIPNLLLTLKPCLMMSPLSVSLYLESDSYEFDTVIFDEASQVFTENAVGAISRAKQVIIAGDSKQLPPTNFFQTNSSDDYYDSDDEEEEETEVFESILDEANMLPERTLNWHYRSRNEGLIAFSNAKIYKNRLITFPSSLDNKVDRGVEYVYVEDGYYDRGGRKGNIVEAKRVVDLIFKQVEEQPERSLGVIAFGEVQQQAIEALLMERRLQDQSYESFFKEDKEEPFFIKSLENVQGDERDTILFSIGYAKDKNGVFRNQFGPLSNAGGERRLNVAITRAKYKVILIGSILPTDINTDKISTEGPKLLRGYIDYAINGPDALSLQIEDSDVVSYDSPFEEAVYNFLDRRGYKVVTQVGCSGYRIDLAVRHPKYNGVYVLGIECDGAAYHSAVTARDRDRLRQDVLEKMGWSIYRVWSTDWIKDPVTEGNKLIEAVEDAINKYGKKETKKALSKETKAKEADYVKLTTKPVNDDPTELYGFKKQKKYRLPQKFTRMYDNKDYDYLDMTPSIETVVANEYPIHIELLCQRLAFLIGNEKATARVRRIVERNISRMRYKIERKGDFLYPTSYKTIPVRLPNERKIQHISEEELMSAISGILKTCIGASRDSIITETSRVYGFARSGQNIYNAMNSAIDRMIREGLVGETEGKLKLL